MDLKLEVVLIPVTDVDRAKAFYSEKAGFHLDVDHRAGDDFRVVQLTPPGSSCSISMGIGITDAEPGSVRGTHLVVGDIEATRADLVQRGVDVSDVRHMTPEGWKPGATPNAGTSAPSPTSPTPTATPGCSRSAPATCRRDHRGGRRARRPHGRGRRGRVRHAHGTPPARAPRPLLPDARLVRRGRGRGAGDVPARLAQPRPVRRRVVLPGVALPHRHERVPRRTPHAAPDVWPPCARSRTCPGSSRIPMPCSTSSHRGTVTPSQCGRARDDRARVPRRAPGAAAAPARRADRA